MLIDIGLLLFVAFGFWRGFSRGIIVSVFSFMGLFLGLLGALKFSSWGAFFLRDSLGIQSDYNPVISFALIMIIIGLTVFIIGKVMEKMIQVVQMGWINKTLGGFLKASIYFLIYCTLIWLLSSAGAISSGAAQQSKLFNFIVKVAPAVFNWLGQNVPVLKGMLNDVSRYYNQIQIPDIFK